MPETRTVAELAAETLGRTVRLEDATRDRTFIMGRVTDIRHRLVGDPPVPETRLKVEVFGDQLIVLTFAPDREIEVH